MNELTSIEHRNDSLPQRTVRGLIFAAQGGITVASTFGLGLAAVYFFEAASFYLTIFTVLIGMVGVAASPVIVNWLFRASQGETGRDQAAGGGAENNYPPIDNPPRKLPVSPNE